MRTRGRFLALSLSFLFLLSAVSAQPNSSSQESEKQVLDELDKATWISSIEWNPENSSQVKVVVHSEIPKQVTIREMPDMRGKSGNYKPNNEPITINSGKNILYAPVNGRQELGIILEDSNDGLYYKKDARPLIGDISRVDFYLFGLICVVSVPVQLMLRRAVSRLILSREPQEVA